MNELGPPVIPRKVSSHITSSIDLGLLPIFYNDIERRIKLLYKVFENLYKFPSTKFDAAKSVFTYNYEREYHTSVAKWSL